MKLFQREDIVKDIEGKRVLYLRRWHLLNTPWFKIYLHRFTAPDQDKFPHDHPWNSWICILKGSYRENIYNSNCITHVLRKPGQFRFMSAKTTHRIVKLETSKVWTLFVCGKKKREWGFHTKSGWIHWKNYLKNYNVRSA